MRTTSTLLLVTCFAGACASGQLPPAAPSSDPPHAPAEPEAKPATQTDAAKPTMESQREPFLQACMAKAHVPDYCECAFDQFRQAFSDADLTKPLEPSDPRLKTLQEKTIASCAGKLNEEQVKMNFQQGCVEGDQRKAKYCTCAWTALRQRLTVADFIGQDETERFLDAKKAMVIACKGKFPVEVAKKDFISACTEGHAEKDKICSCLWQKVKAKVSAEELVAGTVDIRSIPGLDACSK